MDWDYAETELSDLECGGFEIETDARRILPPLFDDDGLSVPRSVQLYEPEDIVTYPDGTTNLDHSIKDTKVCKICLDLFG